MKSSDGFSVQKWVVFCTEKRHKNSDKAINDIY